MKKYRVWGIMVDRSRSDVDLKGIEEILLELEAHFGLEQLGTAETKTYPDFIVRETYPPLFGTPALQKKNPPNQG